MEGQDPFDEDPEEEEGPNPLEDPEEESDTAILERVEKKVYPGSKDRNPDWWATRPGGGVMKAGEKRRGGHDFARLKALPRFSEIHEKLEKGVSCERVAKMIQVDWGTLLEVTEGALVRQLYRYRGREVSMGAVAEDLDWRWMDRIRAKVGDKVTLMERYAWAVNIQTMRVAGMVREERRKNVRGMDPSHNRSLARELKELRELLRESAEVMFRAGVIKEVPKMMGIGIQSEVYIEGAIEGGRPARLRNLASEEVERLPLLKATRAFFDAVEAGGKSSEQVPSAAVHPEILPAVRTGIAVAEEASRELGLDPEDAVVVEEEPEFDEEAEEIERFGRG